MPLAASFACAARWDEAHFPDWDQKTIDKLVTNSPWARTWRGTVVQDLSEKRRLISSRWSQLGMDLPPIPGLGGSRGPAQGSDAPPMVLRVGVELIVRWASALPVRRALVLQEFGRGALEGIRRPPSWRSRRTTSLKLQVSRTCLCHRRWNGNSGKPGLAVPGSRIAGPLSVELPSIGTHVTARLSFPRVENLTPEAGTATFSMEAGDLRVKQEFKLRSMVYEGRLEL